MFPLSNDSICKHSLMSDNMNCYGRGFWEPSCDLGISLSIEQHRRRRPGKQQRTKVRRRTRSASLCWKNIVLSLVLELLGALKILACLSLTFRENVLAIGLSNSFRWENFRRELKQINYSSYDSSVKSELGPPAPG